MHNQHSIRKSKCGKLNDNMLSEYAKNRIRDTTIDLKMEYLVLVLEPVIKKIMDDYYDRQHNDDKVRQPLLTIEDIARKFRVTKQTVHNWKNKGSIVGQKFGKNRYFTEEEVRQSMAKYGFSKQWDNRED